MDPYHKNAHLEGMMVSLNPVSLLGLSRLMLRQVEAARVRHAELLIQLRGLEAEYKDAENSHFQHHISQQIEHLQPQVQRAFDVIVPYTYR